MAAPDLVESRDEDGFTPLHLAVIAGNTQLVTFLLANNADVAAVDNEKHTVVHWATVCGETAALRAVLAAGAPVSTPDVHGGYPLHYAAQMCGGDKDSELGLQVLHALLGHKDINVSVEDGDRRQPLLWAASAGSAKAILALVRAGAIVESSDRDGLTALHCAASRGHTDCIDTLLTLCGASPDIIDSNGCTALHYAVTLGHADATALLLAHGADPNRQDRKGRSPAHCGCAKGQFETVKLIGARGANLWLRNARGDFPLHEAAGSGRRELVAWLLNMRPSQVNSRNNDGRTPLHMAALNDNVDMCKILLDSGASINPILRTSKNIFMTPLDCALQRGFRSTAKYLQLHGGVPASRLTAPTQDAQVTSSLSVQIRDDVTFWGDSTSESDREKPPEGRSARKVHKRKSSFKTRRKKVTMSESESDVVKKDRKVDTATTATNTSALEESPRKVGSSRLDYSSEIIVNGKTEINIHHSNEVTIEETASDQVLGNTRAALVKEKRPRSAKFNTLTKDKSSEKDTPHETSSSTQKLDTPEKSTSFLGQSTGTSDDTMDTVIDTFKQNEEKTQDLPDISNTSEEVDEPKEIVVEASVHPEPKRVTICEGEKEKEEVQLKGILKTTESSPAAREPSEEEIISKVDSDKEPTEGVDEETERKPSATITQQLKVEQGDTTVFQEERKLEICEDGKTRQTVTSDSKPVDSVSLKSPEDLKALPVEEDLHESVKETISSLTTAAVVMKDEVQKRTAKDKEETKAASAESEESPQEVTVKDKKSPVSKVVGKPRSKKHVAEETQKEATKLPRKRDKEKEQSAIVKVFRSNAEAGDDSNVTKSDEEYTSDDQSFSAKQTHKSFKVLSEKEARELQKQPRSKSDDSKFTNRGKQELKASKGSKIPTPIFHTPLSKSERQLDKLLDHEKTTADARVPSLPNIHETSSRERFFKEEIRPDSNLSVPILPSVRSDHEGLSGSDVEHSGLTRRKKVKKKPKKTRRRESRSAGSDYESSNLIDSGFEPSPRSSRIPKWKNMSERGVNMTSVTRSIQSNIRRYHLERKIFQHLLDLKRSQIRAGQHNEAVLVKRAIDQYNQSCASTVGAGRYVTEDFTFKSFERFLYESLRKLQKIDVAYLRGLPEVQEHVNPLLCTKSTHRCMHATHAYTGVPCAAYLPKMDHHSIPKIGFNSSTACKPGTGGFLPSIGSKRGAVTLELSHGTDKQIISLPTDKLDQNKRYYVTFTVKGQEEGSGEKNAVENGHVHAKSD
ncbi:ankyrin repeat domain-containing protein 35 isoform X2 [Anthonomus grandis grandis]|nr:ankyrin repeat domain-containing protein 35 isoform X2 [Anthonomus grandis grandis]